MKFILLPICIAIASAFEELKYGLPNVLSKPEETGQTVGQEICDLDTYLSIMMHGNHAFHEFTTINCDLRAELPNLINGNRNFYEDAEKCILRIREQPNGKKVEMLEMELELISYGIEGILDKNNCKTTDCSEVAYNVMYGFIKINRGLIYKMQRNGLTHCMRLNDIMKLMDALIQKCG